MMGWLQMTQNEPEKKLNIGMNDVIEFYRRNLGSYNMVFKYLKSFWLFFLVVGVLFVLLGVGTIVTLLLSVSWWYWLLLFYMFSLVGFVVSFIRINDLAKKTILDKYKIVSNGRLWGGSGYYAYQSEILLEYLQENIVGDVNEKN